MDTIIVKQERGKDTTITVFEDGRPGYAGPVSWLVFESDQKLNTGSNRAWEANEAIKSYCSVRGYKPVGLPGRFSVQARYSRQRHSGMTTHKLIKRIKADPRFDAAVKSARLVEYDLNNEYAPAVAQLKQLAFELEQRLDERLEQERIILKKLAIELAQEFGIPDVVLKQDRRCLLEPYHPLTEIKADRRMTQELPSDFDAIMRLLED
jgi:rRNA maturation protein Nop10